MLPIIHLEIERWKYNKDKEVYVSTLGRIKDKTKHEVRPQVNGKGYLVALTAKGPKQMHRLVMETFVGKSELTVDHIDSNKRNNKLSNLEYVSQEENQKRACENFYTPPETVAKVEPVKKKKSKPHVYCYWINKKGKKKHMVFKSEIKAAHSIIISNEEDLIKEK